MKKKRILISLVILAALLAVYIKGCAYLPIEGSVVDAETGKPIEGAVVLVQWTKTKGFPGLTHHKIHKIVELETNKIGNFTIPGMYYPLVDSPEIIIYKKGYVAWRNDYIFPDQKQQTNFRYSSKKVFKIERFKEVYSHKQHLDFIEHGIMGLYELPITELPRFREEIKFEKNLADKNN